MEPRHCQWQHIILLQMFPNLFRLIKGKVAKKSVTTKGLPNASVIWKPWHGTTKDWAVIHGQLAKEPTSKYWTGINTGNLTSAEGNKINAHHHGQMMAKTSWPVSDHRPWAYRYIIYHYVYYINMFFWWASMVNNVSYHRRPSATETGTKLLRIYIYIAEIKNTWCWTNFGLTLRGSFGGQNLHPARCNFQNPYSSTRKQGLTFCPFSFGKSQPLSGWFWFIRPFLRSWVALQRPKILYALAVTFAIFANTLQRAMVRPAQGFWPLNDANLLCNMVCWVLFSLLFQTKTPPVEIWHDDMHPTWQTQPFHC